MELEKNLKWDFQPATYEDWLRKAQADLKGEHPNSLISFNADGIAIQPYSTQEQRHGTELPLQKAATGWVISETIAMQDARAANTRALEVLNAGASGLTFQVNKDTNLPVLLKNILIEHITVHFQVLDGEGAAVASNLAALIAGRGLAANAVRGSIQMDVIGNLAATGNWFHANSAADWQAFKEFEAVPNCGGFHKFFVSGAVYSNAGANPAFELAATLAHAHEYLVAYGKQALPMHVNFAIGSDFFAEMAKLRAFRMLWHFLLDQYGLDVSGSLYLSAQNSVRNKSIYDPHVNMLRTTSEAMSAILGNADELEVLPYDFAFKHPSNFSKRIARNQQLLMQFESYFDKVTDPGAGSYHLEILTEGLAKQAWVHFTEIEMFDGLVQNIESGRLQATIKAQAAASQLAFDSGKLVLVGVNKFEKKDERMLDNVLAPTATPELGFTVVRSLLAQRLAQQLENDRLQLENTVA